jgi:GMP synthase-like glutamine amidotransferase
VGACGDVYAEAAFARLPGLDELRQPGVGFLVLGGQAGPVDDERNPWFPAVRELLAASADGEFASLNVCLGGEMLAEVLGQPVVQRAVPQVGLMTGTLRAEAADDPLFSRVPQEFPVVLWHGLQMELPEGAVHLVDGTDAPVQAFRVGRAWGTQFHLEADAALLRGWAEAGGGLPDGLTVDGVVGPVADAEPALEAAMAPVARAFVEVLAAEE